MNRHHDDDGNVDTLRTHDVEGAPPTANDDADAYTKCCVRKSQQDQEPGPPKASGKIHSLYRQEEGRFLMSASCVTISNLKTKIPNFLFDHKNGLILSTFKLLSAFQL